MISLSWVHKNAWGRARQIKQRVMYLKVRDAKEASFFPQLLLYALDLLHGQLYSSHE